MKTDEKRYPVTNIFLVLVECNPEIEPPILAKMAKDTFEELRSVIGEEPLKEIISKYNTPTEFLEGISRYIKSRNTKTHNFKRFVRKHC